MDQNSNFLSEVEKKLKMCVEHLIDEYRAVRVGRANPAILNEVKVDYYGALTPVNQVATISVPKAMELLIVPWDKSMLCVIETAIQKANLGINPNNDGENIRLIFPKLTGEKRTEIVKDIGKIRENFLIQIRKIRKQALDDLKKISNQGEISEDEIQNRKIKLQRLIETYSNKVVEISKNKEQEVVQL